MVYYQYVEVRQNDLFWIQVMILYHPSRCIFNKFTSCPSLLVLRVARKMYELATFQKNRFWEILFPKSKKSGMEKLTSKYFVAPIWALRWDWANHVKLILTQPLPVKAWVQGWDYWAKFLSSVIFPIFQNHQNTSYMYDIMFIFGRCHRSWAAVTHDKYERDLKYLTYTLDK